MIDLASFLGREGSDNCGLWTGGLGIEFSDFDSIRIGEAMGSRFLGSEDIGMEMLVSMNSL